MGHDSVYWKGFGGYSRGQIPLNTPSMHSVIYELDDPMFSLLQNWFL